VLPAIGKVVSPPAAGAPAEGALPPALGLPAPPPGGWKVVAGWLQWTRPNRAAIEQPIDVASSVRFMKFSASFVSGFGGRNQVQDKARQTEGALRVLVSSEIELEPLPTSLAGPVAWLVGQVVIAFTEICGSDKKFWVVEQTPSSTSRPEPKLSSVAKLRAVPSLPSG
jgi:hypothetical protein